jgi:hypothetical protein
MASSPHGSQRPGGGRERRQHPRAAAPWSVTLALDDGPHEARLRDISRAGVCFFLDRPIAPMTLLALELELPASDPRSGDRPARAGQATRASQSVRGSQSIRGNGAVVRCERISPGVEHFEIAIFLHDLSESDRERIDALVHSAIESGQGV